MSLHLSHCAACRRVLREYELMGSALRGESIPVPRTLAADLQARLEGRRSPRRPLLPAGLAVAAAGLVMAVLVFVLWSPPSETSVARAYPAPFAKAVPSDTAIEIMYEAGVDRDAIAAAVEIDPPVPVRKEWRGDTLVLQPEEPLAPETDYSVRAPAPGLPRGDAQRATPPAVPAPVVVTSFRTAPVAVASAPTAEPEKQETPVLAAAAASPQAKQTPATEPTADPEPQQTPVPVAPTPEGAPEATPPAEPSPEGTPPAAPTQGATPTAIPPAATATPLPAATPANGVGIAGVQSPSPTPTLEWEPVRGIGLVYRQHPEVRAGLGRPAGGETPVQMAEQGFEGGLMLWRADLRQDDEPVIYTLFDDGSWLAFPDTFTESDEDNVQVLARPPRDLLAPARGFAKVWRKHEEVQNTLGWATEPERELAGAMQSFARGTMLWSEQRTIYVLYADGRWREFPDLFVEPTPTPTPTPTATATVVVKPTPLPTAVASPAPGDPLACAITPTRGFGLLYAADEDLRKQLGCAVATEQAVEMAEQPFEGGRLLWRGDKRMVYFLASGGTWTVFTDTYRDGEQMSIESPPDGLLAPERGFGKIWRQHAEVREALGWARAPERGFSGFAQTFDGGTLLWSDARAITILYADGRWERLPDTLGE